MHNVDYAVARYPSVCLSGSTVEGHSWSHQLLFHRNCDADVVICNAWHGAMVCMLHTCTPALAQWGMATSNNVTRNILESVRHRDVVTADY